MDPRIVNWQPTLSETAVAQNDVLASTELLGTFPAHAMIRPEALLIVDKGSVGAALEVWVFSSPVSLGVENAAEAFNKNDAPELQTIIPVAAADYTTAGGIKHAVKDLSAKGMSCGWKSSQAQDWKIYAALKCTDAGGGTYTAQGLHFKFTVDVIDSKYS